MDQPDSGPEYLGMSLDEWRNSSERVNWLRGVLSSEYGRELIGIIRSNAPAAMLPIGWTGTPMLDGAAKLTQCSDTMLGMVAGYERHRKLLTEVLTTHAATGAVPKRPGERMNL